MYRLTDKTTHEVVETDDLEKGLRSFFTGHLNDQLSDRVTIGDIIYEIGSMDRVCGNSDSLQAFLNVRVEII